MTEKSSFTTRVTRRFRLTSQMDARVVKNEKGRLELAVVITDKTTAEQLREAWGAIDAARERIRHFQGSDVNRLTLVLRMNAAGMKLAEGFSYAEVAMNINYECLVNLSRGIHLKEEGDLKGYLQSIVAALTHLKAMRMKDEDALSWLEVGIQELSDDRAPWTLTAGPVDRQRVRDAIRQLEREVESDKVVIKGWPRTKKVPLKDLWTPAEEAAVEYVDRLLEAEPDGGGLDRLREATQRALHQGVENSG